MPIVEIKEKLLQERLGRKYSTKEFEELCFNFGIELDEVTSEFEKIEREKGREVADASDADKEPLFKIEVPANRYDLLCAEGLTRALRIFEKREELPKFTAVMPESPLLMRVTTNTKRVRPYVVCAVLRGISLDEESLASFIALQDKLHFNICRKRALVAIGTHDLDTLQPPFLFDARAPEAIEFCALKEESQMTAKQLFAEYHKRGQSQCAVLEYLPLIETSPLFPVIYDSNEVVLSVPPIINGEHSKMKLTTKNVLIECTATDLTKANIVLNTVVTCFSEYCSTPFAVERVRVEFDSDTLDASDSALIATETESKSGFASRVVSSYVTPDFGAAKFKVSTEYINRLLGTGLSKAQMRAFLLQMALHVSAVDASGGEAKTASDDNVAADGGRDDDCLLVWCPPTRADILHAVDICEDVAIAFGYNRILRQLPASHTTAMEVPLNSLSDKIRQCVAASGFSEVLNWCLTSKKDSFERMRITSPSVTSLAVEIENPKTKDFEICRVNLLPSVLRTLSFNIGKTPLPLRLFEVGDVVFVDARYETGARNERRLCVLVCSNRESGFEAVHSVLDRVMQQNGVEFVPFASMPKAEDSADTRDTAVALKSKAAKLQYALSESDRPSFFPKRQANVWVNGYRAGYFGIVHPSVVHNFGIWSITHCMVSALELNLEPFL